MLDKVEREIARLPEVKALRDAKRKIRSIEEVLDMRRARLSLLFLKNGDTNKHEPSSRQSHVLKSAIFTTEEAILIAEVDKEALEQTLPALQEAADSATESYIG